jgi:hypothetical protein
MGRKKQSDEEIRGSVDVIVKVGILYHHNLLLDFMPIYDLLDPATCTICVAGPAHHIENRFFIDYVLQHLLPLRVIVQQKTKFGRRMHV